MTPEAALAWARVVFSILFASAGLFMLVFLTLRAERLSATAIGELIAGAIACGGAPVAMRWPLLFTNGEQKKPGGRDTE